MTELDKAYLAGIIDGEGYIVFTKRNYLLIKVKMTDLNTIKYLHRTTKLGCIYSYNPQRDPQKSHYKVLYTWQVSFGQALTVLESIIPYLITKRKDAFRALELVRIHKSKRLKRGFYQPV